MLNKIRNLKTVNMFLSGHVMRGKVFDTGSARLEKLLREAAALKGFEAGRDVEIAFCQLEDKCLYIKPDPGMGRKYISGEVQDVSCVIHGKDKVLTISTRHDKSFCETKILLG